MNKANIDNKLSVVDCGFTCTVLSNGRQPQKTRGEKSDKAYDASGAGQNVVITGTFSPCFGPTQGVAFNQRIGDTIFFNKMWLNYTINAANTDVLSSARIILFQWHPNSGLVAPTVATILMLVSLNVLSMYDWQYSNQFTILYDRMHSFAGTATNPTASSNQCVSVQIPLGKARKRAEFVAGSANGSEQIYILFISDSAVIPYPVLNWVSRITFTDE